MHDEPTAPHLPDSAPQSGDFNHLVMKALQGDDWKPVIERVARDPDLAPRLAAILAADLLVKTSVGPLAGQPRIDGLEIGEEIARGGMGVVHRAYQPRLDRHVAVKFVLPEADLVRFRAEAEIVGSLDHPNVVRVFDCGEACGRPYLVMQLMMGSLAEVLKRPGKNTLPPREAARIVRDVALGVHHAHQRGLIHRDLKPGKILLDHYDTPYVADFGLARRVDVSPTTEGIVGTVAYMAPEQAQGAKGLTLAIDIHALGVILYELLTGTKPFGEGAILSVLCRIRENSAPAIRTHRPDVPRDLEDICQRCLAKLPEDRYPSAKDLADDLTRYLSGEPIVGRMGGWVRRFVRGIVRRRETDSMSSWHVMLWGAVSVGVAMAGLQTAVSASVPWLRWAAMAYYLLAWGGIVWGRTFTSWGRLNPIEKNSSLVHTGMVLGCASCLPVFIQADGDVISALPAFLAIKGLGIFVHGQWYWGWMYVAGVAYFALAALMPLIPPEVWPAVFGLCSGGFQLWAAMHLRRVHRAASSAC